MKEIEFSRWLFELPAKQHSQFSPSGSKFLPCLSRPSKSLHENSIFSIFLESSHQVDTKNIVKCQIHFFGYFNAPKTPSELPSFDTFCNLNLMEELIWNVKIYQNFSQKYLNSPCFRSYDSESCQDCILSEGSLQFVNTTKRVVHRTILPTISLKEFVWSIYKFGMIYSK